MAKFAASSSVFLMLLPTSTYGETKLGTSCTPATSASDCGPDLQCVDYGEIWGDNRLLCGESPAPFANWGARNPTCTSDACDRDQRQTLRPSCDAGGCDQFAAVWPTCAGGNCNQQKAWYPFCQPGSCTAEDTHEDAQREQRELELMYFFEGQDLVAELSMNSMRFSVDGHDRGFGWTWTSGRHQVDVNVTVKIQGCNKDAADPRLNTGKPWFQLWHAGEGKHLYELVNDANPTSTYCQEACKCFKSFLFSVFQELGVATENDGNEPTNDGNEPTATTYVSGGFRPPVGSVSLAVATTAAAWSWTSKV